MNPAEHHVCLEHLPTPVLVIDGDRVVFGNRSWQRLFGLSGADLIGQSQKALAERLARTPSVAWESRTSEFAESQSDDQEHWLLLGTVAEPAGKLFRTVRSQGPGPGEVTVSFIDAMPESTSLTLTASLVAAAGNLLWCRTDTDVLRGAVEALKAEGYFCSILVLEGEHLRIAAIHQGRGLIEGLEQLADCSITEMRLPIGPIPHFSALFRERRSVFHPDMHELMRAVWPPALAAEHKSHFPVMRGLDTPIFVGGQPYGLLSANHEHMPPAATAAIELFAQLVSAALENVRHHAVAAERLERLSDLQQELVERERLTALGEAAAVMAHEVRNPLGSILNCVSLLRHAPGPGPSAALLGMLEEESLRLEQLVRHLLDFTRPVQLQVQALSAEEVVNTCFRGLVERGGARPERLSHTVDGNVRVFADETLLLLALENLIRNGLEAAPETSPVRVRVTQAERFVCFQVEDEGPGIAEEQQVRIFDPFYTTRASGSGLGLALVRRVAHLHGGEVRVKSGKQVGACLELCLPLQRSEG